jgi:hypothetical protein
MAFYISRTSEATFYGPVKLSQIMSTYLCPGTLLALIFSSIPHPTKASFSIPHPT